MEDKALLAAQLQKKWQPVLEHPDLPAINDSYRKNVTTILLEIQEHTYQVFYQIVLSSHLMKILLYYRLLIF